MSARTHAGARPQRAPARPVSQPHDRHEHEAERAAAEVTRGRSVARWSFSAVASSPVQRQEPGKQKGDDEKKKEALTKTGEALLETKPVKELKDKVLADPGVKRLKDAVTSPAGIAATGAVAAGGVAALGAAHQPLPFQPPSIPLDRITPGLSAQIKYEGPVDRPTFVGLTITYKEQGPKGGDKKSDQIAADIARLKAEQEMFKPASQKAAEQREADAAVQTWIRSQQLPPVTVPILGTPSATPKAEEQKRSEEQKQPVQRAAATATPATPREASVDDAFTGGGRPLDRATRRTMETRFGRDFSGVRIHDDGRAAATAASIDAAAFTVGQDVAFAAGRYSPSSASGRELLAHELAHVVQQSRGAATAGPSVQRRSIFESVGILLGLVEGTWEDRELHAYLDEIARAGRIEGAYDSDNKARAIVRRWKAAAPGFDLNAEQKVLLIREMLDGPTLGDDEECILDLLELSDASDLRAILAPGAISLRNLESDIDGDNRTRLDTFVAGRFQGGRDAVIAGRVVVVGPPLPAHAPRYDFDGQRLDALFDSDRTADELVAIIATYTPAGRQRALHWLSQVRRPRQEAELEQLRERARHLTPSQRQLQLATLRTQAAAGEQAKLKTERVLLHFFRDAAPGTAAQLRGSTVPVDPARRQAVRESLHPPVHGGAAGTPAHFRRKLPGEHRDYDDKVYEALMGTHGQPGIIDATYQDLVAGRGRTQHADPSLVRPLSEFEAIGEVSRSEVLRVFGGYFGHEPPHLRADRPATAHHAAVHGNIHDQFADIERDVHAYPSDRRVIAREKLRYFFVTEPLIRRISAEHDATPDFHGGVAHNAESRLLDHVGNRILASAANVRKLVEMERNWPGAEADGEIYVQIFRGATPQKERLLRWDIFQTLIHEYLHVLVSHPYAQYAATLPAASENTLMEGVCSLLTEIVWTNVEPRLHDHDLREKIEGPALAAQPPIDVPHASVQRYPSYDEALRLVDLVGVRNLYAAYFLGLIDRIGGVLPHRHHHHGSHHP